MRIKNIFLSTKTLIFAKIFHLKLPLAIRWVLTYRCNLRCVYCGASERKSSELDTLSICKMIDEFTKLGVRWISFTGGNPFLRDDLASIVKHAKNKGVYVTISSNDILAPERIEEIKIVDRIKLSLDGPPSINDPIRGTGSFHKTMEAIELCKKYGIVVVINCVLSKYNLDSLDYLINLASNRNLKILFQPATVKILFFERENNLIPPTHKYRNAIDYLISQKNNGAPILNSLAGLHHLHHWPGPKKISCNAGILTFSIEPNGVIRTCGRKLCTQIDKNMLNVKRTLQAVKPNMHCQDCWESSIVEFNLITSFNINAIINYLKMS